MFFLFFIAVRGGRHAYLAHRLLRPLAKWPRLQLTGHIHGGQFFTWNLLVGLVHPFGLGLHRVERRMWLYVCAGADYRGPPSRLGVPAEITSLRLVRA